MRKIAVAGDHGGFALKSEIVKHLQNSGVEYMDMGVHSADPVDYPEVAGQAAEAVAAGKADLAIVCCGTGIGVSIAANKVRGIRAALCHDTFSARMAREHNNANILALGARVIGSGPALDIVDAFLAGSFSGGRHGRRLDKIAEMEKKYADNEQPQC